MRNKFLTPAITCLLVAGLQVQAQEVSRTRDPDTAAQLQELYKKMVLVLSGGEPEKSTMLVLANPGLPLSETFDGGKPQDQVILDQLVDVIPKVAPAFTPTAGGRLSDLYVKILENRQFVKTAELTPDEQKRYDAAKANTDIGSDKMKKYEFYKAAYRAALSAKASAEITAREAAEDLKATPKDNVEALKAARTANMKAQADLQAKKAVVVDKARLWGSNGYRKEIEADTQIISQLAAKSGLAWWSTLKDRVEAARRNDGDLAVIYSPDPSTWHNANASDWTTVAYRYGEKMEESAMKSEAWNAGVSGASGWFSIDSKVSKMDMKAEQLLQNKDFAISVEIKRVSVYRKWYDAGVLQNKFWTLPRTVAGGVISYGDLKQNLTREPGMPLMITSLILARNLKIYTHMSKERVSEYNHSFSTQTSMGLGPFALSGGYDTKDIGRKVKGSVSDAGFDCPWVQVIGFQCTVPPASPAASVK